MRTAELLKRSLDDVGVSWTLAAMRDEGLRIDEEWSPEREPTRRPELKGRPEAAFLLNGEPAVLDVTRFGLLGRGAGMARAGQLREAMLEELEALGDPRAVFVYLSYDPKRLALTDWRREAASQFEALFEAIKMAVTTHSEGEGIRLPAAAIPPWADVATVTIPAKWPRRTVDFLPIPADGPGGTDVLVDEFLDYTIVNKEEQFAGWGRQVLVVVHDFFHGAEELRAGIARRGSVPWWRVYWISNGPPPILVWQSDTPT